MSMEKLPLVTESYINFVRIALATAIIKNKGNYPDGPSYAIHLQKQILSRQNDWKREYDKIKEELLQLKQNQILKDLHSGCSEKTSGATNVGILTPPQTQSNDTQSSQSTGNTRLPTAHPMTVDNPMNFADCREATKSYSSQPTAHHMFLSKIASLKDLTTGSLVVLNSGATRVVIDTYLECISTLKESITSDFTADLNNTDETRSMRRQLSSCMVELLIVSSSISRCEEVRSTLEGFYSQCIQTILCPSQPVTTNQHGNSSDELTCILEKFAENSWSCDFLCRYIIKYIANVTQLLTTVRFTDFTRDPDLLTQIENIPKVTSLLLTVSRIKNRESDHVTPILSVLELINLRGDLDKTLAKFPLYTIHIREVLSRTGHKLPSDSIYSHSD